MPNRPPGRPPGPPPGGRPPGRPPRGGTPVPFYGGLGDDAYHNEGWRDAGQGESRPIDVVDNPNCPPPADPCAKPQVVYVKFPAFNQPPFFAKPLVKVRSSLQIPPGGIALVFDKEVADRQRYIASWVGIDVAPIAPLMNSQLEFWFQLGAKGVAKVSKNIIPVWEDQNPTGYGGTTPVQYGRTTVWPGVATPLDFFQNGMQFGIKGRSQFQGLIQNKSGVTITVRAHMGFYFYWSTGAEGASEWGSGDLQS